MKKAILAALFTLMFVFSAFAVLPGGAHAEQPVRAAPLTPDLSSLTEVYNYSCDGALPSGITLANSTHATYSFVSQAGRTSLKAQLGPYDNATVVSGEYVGFSLPYNPGVKTIQGYVYIPSSSFAQKEYSTALKLFVSLGGGASVQVVLTGTPGADDYLHIYNGSSSFYVDKAIPRIPRDRWVYFILSVDLTSTLMNFYVYFAEDSYVLSTSVARPVGTASYDYFNFKILASAYHVLNTVYVDDLHWYAETYSLDEYIPARDNATLYYKGWDWKDHIWLWERINNGSGDYTDNRFYVNITTYAANFTIYNAVVSIATATDVNRTLNATPLKNVNIIFTTALPNATTAKAISYAAAHDDRVKGIIFNDFSSAWGKTGNTITDYENAIANLRTYKKDLPVYGVVYCHSYTSLNNSAWNLLDGVSIWGWYGQDYATHIDDVLAIALTHYSASNIHIGVYTYFFGDRNAKYGVSATASVQRAIFSKMHDWIVEGKIAAVDVLGPARYLNYKDTDEISTGDFFYGNEEAERYFARLMSLSYSSDGKTITVSREWDGTYVQFDKLYIPMRAQSSSYKIVSHANTKIELQIPSGWNYNNVVVKDLTTGRTVSWQKGSVIFTAEAGHTYIIENVVQQSVNIGIDAGMAVMMAFIPLMMIAMFFRFFGEAMHEMQDKLRNFRK